MSFTYPLGLLGLIAVPILIILYIIKSHYTEQTVASVYLWQLSEKFLKKKKRLRFGGLLSLALQILAVIAISLTIAGPTFILPDAANDYCFVLDASGSMRTEYGETTRFDAGKNKIRKIIEQSRKGSSYTLIYAGTTTYRLCEEETDRETVLALLDTMECEWGSATCTDALALVQEKYVADHSPLTYLVTDKAYEVENVTLINMAQSEENYAFVTYGYSLKNGMLTVSGQVISCNSDAQIQVELYVDGNKDSEVTVEASMQNPTEFEFVTSCETFDQLALRIVNADDFMSDNEGVLYTTGRVQNNKTLIVSDAPFYLQSVLKASGKTSVDVVGTREYNEEKDSYSTGYGLYIFDTGAEPDEVPENAAVWFFNVKSNVKNSGFSYRGEAEAEGMISGGDSETEIENRFEPVYTTATSAAVRSYLKDMQKQSISVKKYSRYASGSREFTSLLYQENDNVQDSLIFVGENGNGCRQVVFAFDLHDTDMPLKADFLFLMNNLLDYSFPAVVEQALYTVGEELTVNVPAGCTDLLLESPAGKITYPDFSSSYAYCELNQVGVYKITASVNGTDQVYYVYSQNAPSESYQLEAGEFEIKKQSDVTTSDGFYDELIIYFLILALAFILDWGVYSYEQYQLR